MKYDVEFTQYDHRMRWMQDGLEVILDGKVVLRFQSIKEYNDFLEQLIDVRAKLRFNDRREEL